MGFAFFCVGTIIISFIMNFKNQLRIYKDIADAGYKIDAKRLSEISKQLDPDAAKTSILELLIPIYNVMRIFKKTIDYNDNREFILDELRVFDVISEMNELEKDEYEKKPTGFNAIVVPLKVEKLYPNFKKIVLNDDDYQGELIYNAGIGLHNITVIKATGPVSLLPYEEQRAIIINKNFQEMEDRVKLRISSDNYDLPKEFTGSKDELLKIEIQILRNMRNELLNAKNDSKMPALEKRLVKKQRREIESEKRKNKSM